MLIAVLAIPTAANAEETHWLLIRAKFGGGYRDQSWNIPTNSKAECEEEKNKALIAKKWSGKGLPTELSAICIKGQ